jgi:hypothetical protein
MKIHEVPWRYRVEYQAPTAVRRPPGWEPSFAWLRDRREGVNERTGSGERRRARRVFRSGAFVHAFSPIVPAAKGGAQPGAFMELHVLHGESHWGDYTESKHALAQRPGVAGFETGSQERAQDVHVARDEVQVVSGNPEHAQIFRHRLPRDFEFRVRLRS